MTTLPLTNLLRTVDWISNSQRSDPDHSLKAQLVHVTGTSAETANERAIALLEMIDQRHDELLERIDELSNRIDQVLAEFSPKKPAAPEATGPVQTATRNSSSAEPDTSSFSAMEDETE